MHDKQSKVLRGRRRDGEWEKRGEGEREIEKKERN
jgi:hypothetical protein